MSMTYDKFIKKHKGKACDTDGVAGAQCVDLAVAYMDEVFNSGIRNFFYDAHHFFDLFNSNSWLKKNFTRIANTPDFVPKKGDIAVWKSSLSSGGWGHIAICTGEGNTNYFYSYDQNWTGKHDPCTKVKHDYNHFAGVLRPKDQTKITGNTTAFKTGNYTLTTNVKVRTGAGKSYSQKLRSKLTADGKKHSLNQTYACLVSGTVVTVSLVEKISSKEYWGKIPSGWIALMYGGKKYVK